MQISQISYDYAFDPGGSAVGTTSRHFDWNHGDQMKAFRTGSKAQSLPSTRITSMTRLAKVKKLVRKQSGQFEVTH